MASTQEMRIAENELSPLWENSLLMGGKRAFDVVVSGSLLLLLSLFFLILAAAVKLTSRGPVFYRWRVGCLAGSRV